MNGHVVGDVFGRVPAEKVNGDVWEKVNDDIWEMELNERVCEVCDASALLEG